MSTRQAPSAPAAAARVFRVPRLREVPPADWAQLVRFCLVGTSGYVINLGVFTLLLYQAGVHYAPAAVVAFAVAWTSNFLLNKHWTFRRHSLSALQQGLRYLLVSLFALGLNVSLLHLLVQIGLPEVPSQAMAIATVMPINFLINRRWSFR